MSEWLVNDVRYEIDRQLPHLVEILPAGWLVMDGGYDRQRGGTHHGLISPDGLAWEIGAETPTMDELTRERDDVNVYLAVSRVGSDPLDRIGFRRIALIRDGEDVRAAVGAALRGLLPAMAAGEPPTGTRIVVPARGRLSGLR